MCGCVHIHKATPLIYTHIQASGVVLGVATPHLSPPPCWMDLKEEWVQTGQRWLEVGWGLDVTPSPPTPMENTSTSLDVVRGRPEQWILIPERPGNVKLIMCTLPFQLMCTLFVIMNNHKKTCISFLLCIFFFYMFLTVSWCLYWGLEATTEPHHAMWTSLTHRGLWTRGSFFSTPLIMASHGSPLMYMTHSISGRLGDCSRFILYTRFSVSLINNSLYFTFRFIDIDSDWAIINCKHNVLKLS